MLLRIRTWQVIVLQLLIGGLSTFFLATMIHYPDIARRPEPQSGKLLLAFLIFVSAGVLTLLAVGVRSGRANTVGVVTSTIVAWLLGLYALVFVWANTYGT
jgi:hypothetical protein